MSKKKTNEEVKNLFDKLGLRLFSIEGYYLVYSELGLHYNKSVNEDTAKAYLDVINANKNFFIPVQEALRSAFTNELHMFIVSNDEESLQKAIKYLSELDNAPNLSTEYNQLKLENANIVQHLGDFRNKYYAHKSGKDLSNLPTSSEKEFQDLFTDIKNLFNKASIFFGSVTWFFDRNTNDTVWHTHNVMDNLVRGESQRVSEIDIQHISGMFLNGKRQWMDRE